MVGCPGCGGKLIFNIESQKMKCSYCSKEYLVAEVAKLAKNAEEHTAADIDPFEAELPALPDEPTMEVMMYTCSQCGGEISADPDVAVTWCTYCGSPAVLQGRLRRIRKPDTIIPFKITREDCVNSYRKIARKQIYAPSAFHKQGHADGFRGFYMPFWCYDFQRTGVFRFMGETVTPEGEDNVIRKYTLSGLLESKFENISHDASLSFDDSVSEHIVPFSSRDAVPFEECYLNGFYGNAADMNEYEYRTKMLAVENNLIYADACTHFFNREVSKESVVSNLSSAIRKKEEPKGEAGWMQRMREKAEPELYHSAEDEDFNKQKLTVKSRMSMFPVWFLSYRWGDRVSYATINGQTGKTYTEFPASPYKYLLFSIICAIPLYFLFSAVLVPSPSFLVFLALAGSFTIARMYKREVQELYRKQFHMQLPPEKKRKWKSILGTIGASALALFFVIIILSVGVHDNLFAGLQNLFASIPMQYVYFALAAALGVQYVIRLVKMHNEYQALKEIRLNLTNGMFVATALVSAVVFLINPASDMVFYMISYVILATVGLSVISLIHGYNLISSNRPKQFERSGGDYDNA